MREVRLRYVTFTGNQASNFDLRNVQLIDILRMYNCTGISEVSLESISRYGRRETRAYRGCCLCSIPQLYVVHFFS
jgi:hypothetical protein